MESMRMQESGARKALEIYQSFLKDLGTQVGMHK